MTKLRGAKRASLVLGAAIGAWLCAASPVLAQGGFFPFNLFGQGWGPARRRLPSPEYERRRAKPKPRRPAAERREPAKPAPAPPAPSAGSEGPPPPYEPQLLRLSEILGALSYLRDLCGARDGDDWRTEMATLVAAEAKTGARRQKLAGAFNRGFRGYEITYRACTPNAELAISRYLEEAGRLARDITYRYGGP